MISIALMNGGEGLGRSCLVAADVTPGWSPAPARLGRRAPRQPAAALRPTGACGTGFPPGPDDVRLCPVEARVVTELDARSQRRVAQLSGKVPVASRRIARGYSPAERWVVSFEDGSTAFAKFGSTPVTAQWLRAEHRVYGKVHGRFMPRLLGYEEHAARPLLLLEDLSGASWPPPWRAGDVERLLETMRDVAATPLARGALPELESERGRFAGWLNVERDAAPFLSLGLCSQAWLDAALPSLLMAQDLALLGGNDLVHGDLRSDNLCFTADRVVLVDWNAARRGNAAHDLAALAPSLRLEGGPLPEELVPGEGALAALASGYFAANAGLRSIPDAPQVRWIQQRQLRIALPWVARSLGLPPPDGSWAQRALVRLKTQLGQGEIDERRWFEGVEEVLGDSYLASDDPRAQSGKSGDDDDWRWSRELILDALPEGTRSAHVLDVGCANGYLMESLARWGEERGLQIEPYGLDISARIAALARRRLPAWADRIAVGNVLEHTPTRRYELVATGLDDVPPARRRESIERLFRHFLLPGGRVVLRPDRVRKGEPDVAEQAAALGLRVGGVLTRQHPSSGELWRSAWLEAP
ncbi:MAG TPA: phosphotransferase [Polyangiaceae bacterium]|nr:phosphotransferase [Polyangiaceae bacterium]